MFFRPANESDIPALIAMQTVFFADAGDELDVAASESAMRQLLADANLGRIFITEARDAYLVLCFGFSLEFGGRDAFVDELYVAPEARNRGLGAIALQLAEAACRDAGVHALHLEVADENPRARALYARSGYYAHERRLMTKRLT